MAFIPLTDEEKKMLQNEGMEEPDESPETAGGGFGGINVSSVPEVRNARKRLADVRTESIDAEAELRPEPAADLNALARTGGIDLSPYEEDSFQGAVSLNPAVPGSGTFVGLSPREQALVEGERKVAPSTAFLAQMFHDAQAYDPETYSKNVQASIATRIPVGMMVQDPEIRDEAWRQKLTLDQLDTLDRIGPGLGSWLKIPGRLGASYDDLPALMVLEELVEQEKYDRETTLPGRGFRHATAMSESGRIWTSYLLTGKITDEQRTRLAELDAVMAKNANKGQGPWDKMLYGAGTMTGQRLPQFSQGSVRGLQMGALSALGAAVLGNMGPQAAFPEELATVPGAFAVGAKTGFGLGVMEEGFAVEAGLAYPEYLEIKDEAGNPLPESYARIGALLYGAGASFLETLQMGRIIKAFPGGAAFLSRQAIGEMLKTKTVQTALKDALAGYGKDLSFEVLTEGMQRLWQIIVGEQLKDSAYAERVAQAIQGGTPWADLSVGEQVENIRKYSSMPLGEIIADVGNEMHEAFYSFALGMMPGRGFSLYHDIRAARTAGRNMDFFKALGETVADSKTAKRLPEAMGEYAAHLTKNGPLAEVGIDAARFTETLEQLGVDPAEVAGKLGIDADDLKEAAATGGDIVVPMGTYIEKVAGTELNQVLLQDLRLGEGEMTGREAAAWEQERQNRLHNDAMDAQKYLEESGAEMADMDYAKSVVKTQLEGLDIKWLGKNEVESYGTLFAAYAVQAARRWNVPVREWVDRLNLTIRDNADGTKSLVAVETRGQPVNEGVDLSGVAKGTVLSPKFANVDAGNFLKGEGRKQLEESVIGEYRNEDTQWNIVLSRRNVSHAISSALSNENVPLNVSLEVIAELPRILERARLVESHDDLHQGRHVRKIHRFYAPAKISTEPDSLYKVKLTVKEVEERLEVDVEGVYRAYDAKVIEKAPADPRQGELQELSTDHTTGTFDVILESLLDGVKDSGGKFYLQDNAETRSQSPAPIDADYLAAVEADDMETARRMVDEAAREAGFVVQHVFHGSKRIDRLGNELKPERATSGPMPFFTDDPTIAENYSQNKADTSLEIPESYNGWFKVNLGRGKPKTIDQAWLYLSLDKRRELAQKLPHVVNTDPDGGNDGDFVLSPDRYGMTDKSHWDHVIREKRGNVLEAAVEIWLDSGELFDQEEKFLEILRVAGLDGVTFDSPWLEHPGVVEAHLAIRTPFDTSAISDDDFAALEAASKGKRGSTNVVDEWDKRRFSGKEWIALLEQDRKDGTSFAWTSIPDWVSRELQRMGYDGIKDQGGKYTGEGHTVWIPFFPWQVKRADGVTTDDRGNVIPLSQRFDLETRDIRYQTAEMGKFAQGASEAETRLKEDSRKFSAVVDDFIAGKLKKGSIIRMMDTPLALHLAGADILPLDVPHTVLQKVLEKHDLPVDVLKQIPEAMADPVMVFRSETSPGSLVVLLDLRDEKRGSVIVPIALNAKAPGRGGYLVNLATSIYYRTKKSGKPQDVWVTGQIEKGNLAYLNQEKSSRWATLSGQTFSDGTSLSAWMDTGNHVQNIPTEADLVKLKAENGALYQDNRSRTVRNGFINRNGGGITITLTPGANRSTFLHELGHLFLWDLESLAMAKKADPRTAGDWDVIKAWWSGHAQELAEWIVQHGKVSDDVRALFAGPEGAGIVRLAIAGKEADPVLADAVRVSAEEYWARGTEQYFMEGIAPSRALRRVFDNFRRWLTKIYRVLKHAPDVELSDEVRAVMDRMLASEEEIDQERSLRESEKLRARLIQQGIPTVEADALREAADEAAAEAKTKLLALLMKELGAETAEEVRRRREAAEPGIREAMRQESAAWKTYDDLLRIAESGYNLAPDERYGEAGPRLTSPEGTISMESAADLVGLDGVEELQALLAEEARNPFDAELNARMDDAVRDLADKASDPEAMRALAEDALRGEARLRLLALEQAILARKIGDIRFGEQATEGQPSPWETTAQQARQMSAQVRAYREVAEQTIAGKRVRDARAASRYLAAARKAGREAYELALKGKYEESLAAKDREMMSTALYQASLAAREELEKAESRLRKYWTGRKRLRVALGEEHFAQVIALTERYGFNGTDPLVTDRIPLGEWTAAANAELGADPNNQGARLPVAKWLITDDYKDRKMSWKDLTLEEFRELMETVEVIDYFGRSRNKLLAAQREADFTRAKQDLEVSVTAVHGKLKDTPLDPDYRGAGPVGRFLASADRVEHILRRLDGFKDMAVAWRTFFDPVVKAERAEMKAMRGAKAALETIFSVYSPEERGEMTKKKYTLQQLDPSTGKPLVLSKENVLALLLNWGARENREEVVFGYGFDRTVWNQGKGWIHYGSAEEYWAAFRMGSAEVEKLFSQVLEEKDYEVAQAVWDLNESYWDDIAAMSKRVTGVTPKKVKPLPVTSASGVTYRGGYMTLKFRPESNWDNFVISEKESSKALYTPQGSKAYTKSGHTMERHQGERGKRLLRLDLGVETEHLRDALHDLYFRPVIRDLNKLLADPQVQKTIIGSIGMEAFKQFQPWVNGLANAYRTPSNYGEQMMQKVMGRTSAAILGWSLSSAAKQVFGWFPAVQVLGYKRTALAAFNFWRNPFQWGEMRDFAFEKSEYLRDRVRSFDRDVKAAMEAVTASPVRGRWSAVQETFFLFAGWMDMAVSLPVWTAAWDKGMLEFNGDEAKALEYADFVVRSTQNTGAAKDLAAIQQGSPAWKSMTMFYTAFGSMFQQTREQWFRGHGMKDIPRLAAFTLTMYVLPALLEDLMSGRGPEEDEPDDILRWALNSVLQYSSSQLILVRDVVNSASSGFSYRMSPMASAGTAAAKVMNDLLKSAEWALGGDEPDWEKIPGHLVEISGPAFGLPSNQIMRTMKAVGRYLDNDPDWSPWDFVITPPKKKGRR